VSKPAAGLLMMTNGKVETPLLAPTAEHDVNMTASVLILLLL